MRVKKGPVAKNGAGVTLITRMRMKQRRVRRVQVRGGVVSPILKKGNQSKEMTSQKVRKQE